MWIKTEQNADLTLTFGFFFTKCAHVDGRMNEQWTEPYSNTSADLNVTAELKMGQGHCYQSKVMMDCFCDINQVNVGEISGQK